MSKKCHQKIIKYTITYAMIVLLFIGMFYNNLLITKVQAATNETVCKFSDTGLMTPKAPGDIATERQTAINQDRGTFVTLISHPSSYGYGLNKITVITTLRRTKADIEKASTDYTLDVSELTFKKLNLSNYVKKNDFASRYETLKQGKYLDNSNLYYAIVDKAQASYMFIVNPADLGKTSSMDNGLGYVYTYAYSEQYFKQDYGSLDVINQQIGNKKFNNTDLTVTQQYMNVSGVTSTANSNNINVLIKTISSSITYVGSKSKKTNTESETISSTISLYSKTVPSAHLNLSFNLKLAQKFVTEKTTKEGNCADRFSGQGTYTNFLGKSKTVNVYGEKNYDNHKGPIQETKDTSASRCENYYIKYTCQACHQPAKPNTPAPESHNLVLIETIEPTCRQDGKKKYKCSKCSYTQEEILPATHKWAFDCFTFSDEPISVVAKFRCSECSNYQDNIVKPELNLLRVYTDNAGDKWGVYEASLTYNGNTYSQTDTMYLGTDPNYNPEQQHNHSYKRTISKQPTCEADGEATYTCSCGETYKETIKATGHNYAFDKWEWDGHTSAKAVFKCKNNPNHIIKADAVITSEEISSSCTGSEMKYTAQLIADRVTYSDVRTEVNGSGTGHDYMLSEWKWDDNHVSTKAVFVCQNDSSHKVEVDASIKDQVTDSTCSKAGELNRTATVTFEGKQYTDTYTEIINKKEHKWDNGTIIQDATSKVKGIKRYQCLNCNEYYDEEFDYSDNDSEYDVTWNWDDNDIQASTVTFIDKNNSDNSETLKIQSYSITTTAPSCDTASVTNIEGRVEYKGKVYSDTHTITGDDKLGHDYTLKEFIWSDDYSSAQAIFECQRNEEKCSEDNHTLAIDANVTTKEIDTTQGCRHESGTKYIASVEFEGETYEDIQGSSTAVFNHQSGNAVTENMIDATFDTTGSYDEVVYCTECGEELYRKNIIIPVKEKELDNISDSTENDDDESNTEEKQSDNKESISITFKLNGGKAGDNSKDVVKIFNYGDQFIVPEGPVREGWTFLYWKGSVYYPGDIFTVTENHTLTAVYKNNTDNTIDDGSQVSQNSTENNNQSDNTEKNDESGGIGNNTQKTNIDITGEKSNTKNNTSANDDNQEASEGNKKNLPDIKIVTEKDNEEEKTNQQSDSNKASESSKDDQDENKTDNKEDSKSDTKNDSNKNDVKTEDKKQSDNDSTKKQNDNTISDKKSNTTQNNTDNNTATDNKEKASTTSTEATENKDTGVQTSDQYYPVATICIIIDMIILGYILSHKKRRI